MGCRWASSSAVPPSAHVVLLEERVDGTYLVPSGPLGPWMKRPLTRILRTIEPGTPLILDLVRARLSTPAHVACVLWVARQTAMRGLPLAIEVPDMVSAELLAFSGVAAAVGVSEPVESPVAAPSAAAESSA